MTLVPSHPSDVPRRPRPGVEVPEIDVGALEEVPRPSRCLMLVAHPDDDCFGCSGTMAKWAASGTEVDLVVATDGSKGSHDLSIAAEEVAATRQREQRRAAELLGYRGVHFLGHPDGELVVSEGALRAVVDAIRVLRPEIVVGHDPWRLYQLHPDHRAAGELVRDAVWRAGEPRFHDGPAWKPRELWLFHAQEPNHVEDISAWMEAKWEALMCHESQYSSAFRFEAADSAEQSQFREWFTARFAALGKLAGFAYGEAFRRVVV